MPSITHFCAQLGLAAAVTFAIPASAARVTISFDTNFFPGAPSLGYDSVSIMFHA